MSIRSALFGSRLRVVAVVLVVLVAAIAVAFATGLIGTPTVTGVENRFGPVNDTTTVIESNLTVANPNPVGASAGGLTVDYAVEMNDIRMATGTKNGVSVSSGTSDLPFTTTMRNTRIPSWWVSHIRGGEETTLTVAADIHSEMAGATFDAPQVTRPIETDLLSQFNSSEPRPVNADSAVVSDPVVYVNETRASWGQVTNETTELDIAFVVYNPKSYPVGMTQVGYDIGMNGVTLGEGTTERGVVIPPGETRTIETTTRLQNQNFDEWWVTHLERNQVSELRIDFSAQLDLRATTVDVPLSALTYTKSVETDIFGTKPESAQTPTPGGDSTETSTDSGDETATATPGETQTPTATDSDDGGLLGSGETTATPESTPTKTATDAPTPTPTATPTPTESDDGGLLGSYRAPIRR